MAYFFLEHWGDLLSLVGVLVSAIGLWLAFREARRARRAAQNARAAARAAEKATIETRNRIGRHLTIVDMERSVAIIRRLKYLQGAGRWEAALEQYHALRELITDIIARYPEMGDEIRERMNVTRELVRMMEEYAERQVQRGFGQDARDYLNQLQNRVLRELEDVITDLGGLGE